MTMRVIGGFHTVNFYCIIWSRYYLEGLPHNSVLYELPDGVSVLDKCVVVKKRGRP
jgi:hypothetical protein